MITAIRTPRGRLHIARQDGAEWVAACWRAFPTTRPGLIVYRGRQLLEAYRWETRCLDCEALLNRGVDGFRRATGWN